MDSETKIILIFGLVAGWYYGVGGFKAMIIGLWVNLFTFSLGYLSSKIYRKVTVNNQEVRTK